MKNIVLVIIALGAGYFIFQNTKKDSVQVEAKSDPINTQENSSLASPASQLVIFSVEGMHCPTGCSPKVEKALSSMPGVENVSVDFEKKQAQATLSTNNKETNIAAMITAIKNVGFQASLIN